YQNVSGTTNNGFYAKATADIASTNAAALDTNGTAVVADLQTAAFVAADVDATRALAPSLVLNGIFGYLGYDWCECDWAPFLGVGFNADFGRRNFPLSQWGVFLKGGVQF
ncbi:hypothetical protein M1466_00510, partial [Candidatus Dependentiae bacterium]|nr:hypothetical protein [Candidatus Dependentiae bacterium]